eukprot:gene9367-11506_t
MSTNNCASCGSPNAPTCNFCTKCGNRLLNSNRGSTLRTAPVVSTPNPNTINKTTSFTSSSTTTSTSSRPSIEKRTTSISSVTPPKALPKLNSEVSSGNLVKSTATSTSKNTTTTTSTAPKPLPESPNKNLTLNRPKSHTISYSKPTTTTTTTTTSTNNSSSSSDKPWPSGGSFVKNAARSREEMDSKARRDTLILQGAATPINHKKSVSSPIVSSSTTNTTNNVLSSPSASASPPVPPKKPQHLSTKISSDAIPNSPTSTTKTSSNSLSSSSNGLNSSGGILKNSEERALELEKQIQLEKDKYHQKEREIEKQRQVQLEKEKEQEKQKQLEKDKEKQMEKEKQLEKEKERMIEKEKQQEREKQKQLEKEKEKHAEREKQLEKEKQKQLEKEKQLEKDKEREVEKEKQRLLDKAEKERLKQEKEKERLEKELEKEKQKQLEKEKLAASKLEQQQQKQITSSPSINGSHSPNSDGVDGNEDEISSETNGGTPTQQGMSFSEFEAKNKDIEKKKRDRDKYNTSPAGRSRFFSFIHRERSDSKDYSESDDLVISSPNPAQYQAANSESNISTSPSSSFSQDQESAPNSSFSTDSEARLRKWAIKRNELQKSEKDLLISSPLSSSPSGSSLSVAPNTSSSSSSSTSPIQSGQSRSSIGGFVPSSSISSSISGISTSSSSSSFILGSSRISSPNPTPDLPDLPPATDTQSKVVEEIIVTEADYIRDLEIMVWLKKEMMSQEEATKPASLEEINILFSNVEQLLMVNKELYKKFSAGPDFIKSIAEGFISMADFLKSYFVYCSNQQKALATFSGLRGKNCSYLGYLLSRRECRSLPFDSFLIKPVQRVCKYPLLLRELIKSTPQSTQPERHASLLLAQGKIETIVVTVNERKREFDSQMRMQEIQTLLIEGGCETKILSPSRKLVKEGSLDSWGYTIPGNQSTQYNKKSKEGHYYLFNDLFLYTQTKSDILSSHPPIKMKAYIPLDCSLVKDVQTDPNSFEFIFSIQQIWMFTCPTPEEKQTLFNEIDNLIEIQLKNEYKKYAEEKEREHHEKKAAAAAASDQNNRELMNSSSNSSSSSSSGIESFDEWRKAIRNKPLPLPPSSPIDSPINHPRNSKALPSIPTDHNNNNSNSNNNNNNNFEPVIVGQ